MPKAERWRRSNLDKLWAPWRLKYIESTLKPSTDCFICDTVGLGINAFSLKLYEDELTMVIMNKFPYNNGHLLIAPRKHVGDLSLLTAPEGSALFATLQKATGWLKIAYEPHGFNVGMNLGRVAGAGLPDHLHIHIVPRWSGDMNFMPVIGEVKVMSESLEAGWERIFAAIEKSEN